MLVPALAALFAACAPDLPTGRSPDAPSADRAPAPDSMPSSIALVKVGRTAFDAVCTRLSVVNGALGTVDVVGLRDPSAPTKAATRSVAAYSASANSVAAHGGVVAVAVEASVRTAPGTVVCYRATTRQPTRSVAVGALPDMLTCTPPGRTVVVAHEGEPNAAYSVDPDGSVSIIDVANGHRLTVRAVTLGAFDGKADALRADGEPRRSARRRTPLPPALRAT